MNLPEDPSGQESFRSFRSKPTIGVLWSLSCRRALRSKPPGVVEHDDVLLRERNVVVHVGAGDVEIEQRLEVPLRETCS